MVRKERYLAHALEDRSGQRRAKKLGGLDGGGQVAGISLQGRDSSGADASTALPKAIATSDLLAQMIGSHLQVEAGTTTISGALLGIEKFKLRAGLQEALASQDSVRIATKRNLEIRVVGNERRKVRVGFVTSAPIWKTSYRLNTSDANANLQAWAILENQSGQAWDGVELTLTSGRPVSFQQNLFDPIHRTRPVVPVEQLGVVMPRVDQGTTAAQQRPSIRDLVPCQGSQSRNKIKATFSSNRP